MPSLTLLTPPPPHLPHSSQAFDTDGSGDIDKAEVERAVREFWGIPLEQPELDSMFTLYDSDGNGTLDMDEFRTMLANLDE